MDKRNLKFELKKVKVKTVKEIMKKMRKKKSSGQDEKSQECLLLGLKTLAAPLTKLINQSIESGTVPESWKSAVVTPILK